MDGSEHVLDIEAPPAQVYTALTEDVGCWWDADHSYTGDAHNFSMDARAGGCFCEDFPNGGSIEHLRVLYADPGKFLRMQGGLGPLQSMPVSGVMDFEVTATEKARDSLIATACMDLSVLDWKGWLGLWMPFNSVS